jgi:hypothetical protein
MWNVSLAVVLDVRVFLCCDETAGKGGYNLIVAVPPQSGAELQRSRWESHNIARKEDCKGGHVVYLITVRCNEWLGIRHGQEDESN